MPPPLPSNLKRTFALCYGLLALVAGSVSSAYQIAFVGNFVLPHSVDRGGQSGPTVLALSIDTILLGLFGLQHSIMARPWFKSWWNKWISTSMERATYVILVGLTYALLFWQWRLIPVVLWNVEQPAAVWLLRLLFAGGWVLVLWSSYLINPWDMWGFRHVWAYIQGVPYKSLDIQVLGPYRWIRHPIMLGLFVAFWASPLMTLGHALFAAMMTAYGTIATVWEEKDLVRNFPDYEQYRNSTPMILPRLGRRRNGLEGKRWI